MQHSRYWQRALASFVAAFSLLAPPAIAKSDPRTEAMVANPIIPGFNPDPSIIRVGEDYYLATSTFEYFPGVPIYHSRNLVNWTLIGHALHRPEQLDLDGVASTAGIYAPTLRHHNGTYYLITTLVASGRSDNKGGNFIVTSKDPRGPWSDPIWVKDAEGIDPSLFFDDDGKIYYSGNGKPENQIERTHKMIWTQELDPQSLQLKGPRSVLDSRPYYRGGEKEGMLGNVVAFEGPHIYKKDGTYYLVVAHGGTGATHAESIWRSNSPMGPWELGPKNPIVTHRDQLDQRGINATGHADLVQTQNGEWWMVLLAIRSKNDRHSAMGRETFMVPVDWSGDWPVVNPDGEKGRVPFAFAPPRLPGIKSVNHDFTDRFSSPKLDKRWNFVRTPRSTWWDLGKGRLRLALRPDHFDEFAQPSFVGARVPAAKVRVSVMVSFSPQRDGEAAGLAIIRGHDGDYTLVKERINGALQIVAYANGKAVGTLPWRDEFDGPVELTIELRDLRLNFHARGRGMKAPATIAKDVDAAMLGFQPSGRFTGSLAGPFATSNGRTTLGYALFDDFSMQVVR